MLREIASAAAGEVWAGRVGVRLAPFITARNMACPDIAPTILDGARALSRLDIAYLHLSEADWDDAPQVPEQFRRDLRAAYDGRLIVAAATTGRVPKSFSATAWPTSSPSAAPSCEVLDCDAGRHLRMRLAQVLNTLAHFSLHHPSIQDSSPASRPRSYHPDTLAATAGAAGERVRCGRGMRES